MLNLNKCLKTKPKPKPTLVFKKCSCWRGVVASIVRRMNEVTLRRARLVLGWVTIFGRVFRHGM